MIKLYQSTVNHQSAIKAGCVKPHQSTATPQSATERPHIKEQQSEPSLCSECPTLPTFQLSLALLQPLLKEPNSILLHPTLPSKLPSPLVLNLAHSGSSGIITNSLTHMPSTISGTASLTTAPTTIPTKTCLTHPSMPQPNLPQQVQALPGPLVLLATSCFQS